MPVVSALTILGHLLKTGKAKPDDNVGEVIVVQSVDDVLALDPGFGMSMLQEAFLRPDNVTVLVKKLTDQAESHGKHIAVSVFTTIPYSLQCALTALIISFYLFDSHSHGQSGALNTNVPFP